MRVTEWRLYYDTVKYLKWSQILYRSKHGLQYKLYPAFGDLLGLRYRLRTARFAPLSRSRRTVFFEGMAKIDANVLAEHGFSLREADRIRERRFRFLNEEKVFPEAIAWRDAGARKLWTYNLHYMDYLIPLALAHIRTGDPAYLAQLKRLTAEWIERNPIGLGDGWEPYPLSLRIVNWIKVYELVGFSLEADAPFLESWMGSLFAQAAFLFEHLEFHHGANHLMENIKTTIYAGLFFDNRLAEKWLEKGLRLFRQEVLEQFLPDGGHYERSPMYHLLMLEGVTEIYLLLRNNRIEVPQVLEQRIADAYVYACGMLHPDGEISLFNDSAFGIASPPRELLPVGALLFGLDEIKTIFPASGLKAYLLTGKRYGGEEERPAATAGPAKFEHSGYFLIRNPEAKMIIDCGRLGPDYNPAHSHADLLSYELSVGGQRWIVDSGTYEYAGDKRARYRGTESHNTAKVDGVDQSELWSTFRVARRACPAVHAFREAGGLTVFSGSHDGYQRLMNPVVHRRTIVHRSGLFVVLDRFEGPGLHVIDNYVHLHPDVEAAEESGWIRTFRGERSVYLAPFHAEHVSLETSAYSDEFGKERDRRCLRLNDFCGTPHYHGYAIFYGRERVEQIEVRHGSREGGVSLEVWVNGNIRLGAWVGANSQIEEWAV